MGGSKRPAEVATLTELARVAGVAVSTASRWSRRGLVVRTPAGDRIDVEATLKRVREARRAGTMGTKHADQPKLSALRAKILAEKGRLLELERKEREGALLPVEEARRFWAGVLIACRTRLLAIPPRLRQRAPELPLELVRIVEEEIREALEELSDPDSSVHEIAQRARRKKS